MTRVASALAARRSSAATWRGHSAPARSWRGSSAALKRAARSGRAAAAGALTVDIVNAAGNDVVAGAVFDGGGRWRKSWRRRASAKTRTAISLHIIIISNGVSAAPDQWYKRHRLSINRLQTASAWLGAPSAARMAYRQCCIIISRDQNIFLAASGAALAWFQAAA